MLQTGLITPPKMEFQQYSTHTSPSRQAPLQVSLSIVTPRTFFEPGSINLDSDTSQSSEEDQYVVSEEATIREPTIPRKDLVHRSSILPSHNQVLQRSEDSNCEYLYSLYPGPRSSVFPDSVTAIICHNAGISRQSLQNAANVWSRACTERREIHVALLKKNFGLVLPAQIGCGNMLELIDSSERGSSSRSDGYPRSDFEASAFMAFMPNRAYPIIQKANPADLACRMLPAGLVPAGARFVAACFWSFLCVIDDLTEDGECSDCIDTAITSLTYLTSLTQLDQNIRSIWSRSAPENPTLKDCKVVITAFHHAVATIVLHPSCPEKEDWKLDFWHEVGTVVRALQSEKPLHGRNFSMNEWMRLRILTISARPFMVLARASLGLPTNLDAVTTSPKINQMQVLVQSVTGLQNDLLGWQKDHIEKNPMCVVEVMIRDGMPHDQAFEQTLTAHNDVVRALLNLAELGPSDESTDGWSGYVSVLVGFCHAMATWMLESKRYRVLDERMREAVSKKTIEARFANGAREENEVRRHQRESDTEPGPLLFSAEKMQAAAVNGRCQPLYNLSKNDKMTTVAIT